MPHWCKQRLADLSTGDDVSREGDFVAELAALAPRSRVNLTGCHGAFASNVRNRTLATRAQRGKGRVPKANARCGAAAEERLAMRWAQHLEHVFDMGIETCLACDGVMKAIACIEDPAVIERILDHLDHYAKTAATGGLPQSRASPANP